MKCILHEAAGLVANTSIKVCILLSAHRNHPLHPFLPFLLAVSTKVDMRINIAAATWLPPYVRIKILALEANRINKKGELHLTSSRFRTQPQNIEDCVQRL
jgi:hypothetical protein